MSIATSMATDTTHHIDSSIAVRQYLRGLIHSINHTYTHIYSIYTLQHI